MLVVKDIIFYIIEIWYGCDGDILKLLCCLILKVEGNIFFWWLFVNEGYVFWYCYCRKYVIYVL